MMDKGNLSAMAEKANFVSADEGRVAFHVSAVNQINRLVADAAERRVSIEHPPESYDALRMQYAREAGTGR